MSQKLVASFTSKIKTVTKQQKSFRTEIKVTGALVLFFMKRFHKQKYHLKFFFSHPFYLFVFFKLFNVVGLRRNSLGMS